MSEKPNPQLIFPTERKQTVQDDINPSALLTLMNNKIGIIEIELIESEFNLKATIF